MSSSVFDRLSRRVARDFLNTVVVVDDRAFLPDPAPPETPRVLKPPSRQGGGVAAPAEAATSKTHSSHSLDAKQLTDAFARIGVACAILQPREQELAELESLLSPLAAGSDVVVLDWVLHEFKQGEKTMEIIKGLLRPSRLDRGRARLIIVYTGENDLDQIASSIRASLKLTGQTDVDDPLTIEWGAARICVYAKGQGRLPALNHKRSIEITEMPDVIVAEFANMTRGLVSNVALCSLATLRTNTYQLLKRFHRELDPPYITHSTLLLPEDASDHLVPLIVSEIQAVLEDEKVSKLADIKRVIQWLNDQIGRGLTFTLPQGTSENEFRQGLVYLLEHGVSEKSLDALFRGHKKFSLGVLKSKTKAVDMVRDQLTEIMTKPRDRGAVTDHELAHLMSVRSRYSSPPPRLTLGSIVLETQGRSSQYLLCVQPRCDSVRLESERCFPFLPMKQVKDNQKCEFIVEERSSTIRLRLNDKPFETRMVRFVPASDKQVMARGTKNGCFFKASGTKSTYRWVADLKPEHAQRVANQYAYKLSRVGLAESEWLRRGTPGLGD